MGAFFSGTPLTDFLDWPYNICADVFLFFENYIWKGISHEQWLVE